MRTDTKKFAILDFIGQHKEGVRSGDVEYFIVTQLQHRTWDPQRRAGIWDMSLYGYGRGHNRKLGIYETYCTKVGKRWFLNMTGYTLVKEYYSKQGCSSATVYGLATGTSIRDEQRSDRISASGSELVMTPLPDRVVEQISTPSSDRKVASSFTAEELEIEAVKVLRETRAALKLKTEEFNRVSKELLDAKLAEKEAVSVLKQVLGL
jgi:hypothetical protein